MGSQNAFRRILLASLGMVGSESFNVEKGSLLTFYLYTKTYHLGKLRIIATLITFTVKGLVILETLSLTVSQDISKWDIAIAPVSVIKQQCGHCGFGDLFYD